VPTPIDANRYLSITDLCRRWSCGRSFAYAAVGDMARAGYFRRIPVGRQHRIALESVEIWERLHEHRADEEVAQLRRQVVPNV